MEQFTIVGEDLWTRMERAVERVNEGLRKTVRILEEAAEVTVDGLEVRRTVCTRGFFQTAGDIL
jgi:hypothetical protein